MTEQQPSFACDMSAIAAGQRSTHAAATSKLFRAVESISELPDGYRFRLPHDPDLLLTAAEFIALERLCCPFFGFALEVERDGGAAWLSLTGRGGVKPFILAEIGGHLPDDIQKPRWRERVFT